MHAPLTQKNLGAFYTPSEVANVLVEWAVRNAKDHVLDPSCGDGVFIRAACHRLAKIGGNPTRQVFGIELDRHIYSHSLAPLLEEMVLPPSNAILSDFFNVLPSTLPRFEVVVGNPPFVRYQTFKGESREKALGIARRLGVLLSELTSSWAPFLVHASQFLAAGGRLAMVVPAEICHAAYARPVVQYLTHTFHRIFMVSFGERLFPDLNQDTMLLFAESFGQRCGELRLRKFRSVEDLAGQMRCGRTLGRRISVRGLEATNGRLRNHFLPREITGLHRFLGAGSQVCRLGELASVGIGYVTGANDFFHLSKSEAERYQIPKSFLRPTLLRSGIVSGLRISRQDWVRLRDTDSKAYLLTVPRSSESDLPKGIRSYLAIGRKRGVDKAYKCAVRKPWYTVPHSAPAEAFLTYMSGEAPRLTWNEAHLLATNSVHEVRVARGCRFQAWKIPFAFCCSLSQLSSEIEGHPLGGGMLKLEPSEAERVLIIRPDALRITRGHFEEMDSLVRSDMMGAAVDLADEIILRDVLALTWDQIQVLREGLRDIKQSRRKTRAPLRGD